MTAFDLIIRGGTVATGSDVMSCDVGVKAGRSRPSASTLATPRP